MRELKSHFELHFASIYPLEIGGNDIKIKISPISFFLRVKKIGEISKKLKNLLFPLTQAASLLCFAARDEVAHCLSARLGWP